MISYVYFSNAYFYYNIISKINLIIYYFILGMSNLVVKIKSIFEFEVLVKETEGRDLKRMVMCNKDADCRAICYTCICVCRDQLCVCPSSTAATTATTTSQSQSTNQIIRTTFT